MQGRFLATATPAVAPSACCAADGRYSFEFEPQLLTAALASSLNE
ncbi:hypothetical protein ACCUM_0435 [Candidatus Accumulibacter phosphatis]|uniref:Uncharacterized protein n=1 Tax=Candidatus Accumulibacter phosphatis TaxID=327160 RepID=A0A5S4EGR0_9PROT|nr:hypothetical protein ACCUM_0435 [Candidatus Accumulibacter phosphatis]